MSSPRKPRFRYSLRSLLVFITLFAVWGGYHGNRAHTENRAARMLERLGARVTYNSQSLIQAIFCHTPVLSVDIASVLEPDVVSALAALTDPKEIVLHAPATDDEEFYPSDSPQFAAPRGAIESILRRKTLRSLEIDNIAVDESASRAIREQLSLEQLSLYHVKISEEAFAMLMRLPRLRVIKFLYCSVNGEQLSAVPGNPRQSHLNSR